MVVWFEVRVHLPQLSFCLCKISDPCFFVRTCYSTCRWTHCVSGTKLLNSGELSELCFWGWAIITIRCLGGGEGPGECVCVRCVCVCVCVWSRYYSCCGDLNVFTQSHCWDLSSLRGQKASPHVKGCIMVMVWRVGVMVKVIVSSQCFLCVCVCEWERRIVKRQTDKERLGGKEKTKKDPAASHASSVKRMGLFRCPSPLWKTYFHSCTWKKRILTWCGWRVDAQTSTSDWWKRNMHYFRAKLLKGLLFCSIFLSFLWCVAPSLCSRILKRSWTLFVTPPLIGISCLNLRTCGWHV